MDDDTKTAVGAPLDAPVRPLRLWIVRIVREAYVLAQDVEQAKRAQHEIERWEDSPSLTAEPWSGRLLDGWDNECGVYGMENVSLRTAKKVDSAD